MNGYYMEFVLLAADVSEQEVNSCLLQAAASVKACEFLAEIKAGSAMKSFKVSLQTQDPTLIFDICSQLGRISMIKVEEVGKEKI